MVDTTLVEGKNHVDFAKLRNVSVFFFFCFLLAKIDLDVLFAERSHLFMLQKKLAHVTFNILYPCPDLRRHCGD